MEYYVCRVPHSGLSETIISTKFQVEGILSLYLIVCTQSGVSLDRYTETAGYSGETFFMEKITGIPCFLPANRGNVTLVYVTAQRIHVSFRFFENLKYAPLSCKYLMHPFFSEI